MFNIKTVHSIDRYKFDNTQLKVFMNDTNKDWFDND